MVVFARRLAASILVLVVAGCSATGIAQDVLAGSYVGHGSSAAVAPLEALTARFEQLHPQVDFKLSTSDAETGVILVSLNQADFGFISRDLYAEEVGKVELVPMTGTGTAVAVNAINPVQALTKAQVHDIFSGKITDWGAVGGLAGHPIRVVVREATSSTRASFESYFFPDEKPNYPTTALYVLESANTYEAVRSFPDSIAMVTLQNATLADKSLRLLALDGVAATTSNVTSGAYPIRRPVYFVVNKDPGKVKPAVRALLEFMKSPEGLQILSAF